MDWCKDTQTLNDHDQLRFDPMFGLAVGVKESTRCCPPWQKYLE